MNLKKAQNLSVHIPQRPLILLAISLISFPAFLSGEEQGLTPRKEWDSWISVRNNVTRSTNQVHQKRALRTDLGQNTQEKTSNWLANVLKRAISSRSNLGLGDAYISDKSSRELHHLRQEGEDSSSLLYYLQYLSPSLPDFGRRSQL